MWLDSLLILRFLQPPGKLLRCNHAAVTVFFLPRWNLRKVRNSLPDGWALPKLKHREMKTLTAEQFAPSLREAKESGVFELYYVSTAWFYSYSDSNPFGTGMDEVIV